MGIFFQPRKYPKGFSVNCTPQKMKEKKRLPSGEIPGKVIAVWYKSTQGVSDCYPLHAELKSLRKIHMSLTVFLVLFINGLQWFLSGCRIFMTLPVIYCRRLATYEVFSSATFCRFHSITLFPVYDRDAQFAYFSLNHFYKVVSPHTWSHLHPAWETYFIPCSSLQWIFTPHGRIQSGKDA